jgi:hypothetical protein
MDCANQLRNLIALWWLGRYPSEVIARGDVDRADIARTLEVGGSLDLARKHRAEQQIHLGVRVKFARKIL